MRRSAFDPRQGLGALAPLTAPTNRLSEPSAAPQAPPAAVKEHVADDAVDDGERRQRHLRNTAPARAS